MDHQSHAPLTDDHAFPMGFVVVPAFVGALLWLPTVRVPRLSAPVFGAVAAASMVTFLIHWQVWPLFTPWLDDRVAYLATVGVGVGAWWAITLTSGIDGVRPLAILLTGLATFIIGRILAWWHHG